GTGDTAIASAPRKASARPTAHRRCPTRWSDPRQHSSAQQSLTFFARIRAACAVLRRRAMAHAPRYAPLGAGPFAKTHADFTEVDAFDWASLGAQITDPKVRDRGRRSFVLRALDEQRSLLAFSELLSELCESGAPIDVIGSLARVVRDEALHVDLCDRVVRALGGWDDGAPEPHWVRSDKRLPLRRRVLATVIGSLCVGETVSVQMIRGVRESASDPVTHAVLTRMLADESFHSRF